MNPRTNTRFRHKGITIPCFSGGREGARPLTDSMISIPHVCLPLRGPTNSRKEDAKYNSPKTNPHALHPPKAKTNDPGGTSQCSAAAVGISK